MDKTEILILDSDLVNETELKLSRFPMNTGETNKEILITNKRIYIKEKSLFITKNNIIDLNTVEYVNYELTRIEEANNPSALIPLGVIAIIAGILLALFLKFVVFVGVIVIIIGVIMFIVGLAKRKGKSKTYAVLTLGCNIKPIIININDTNENALLKIQKNVLSAIESNKQQNNF